MLSFIRKLSRSLLLTQTFLLMMKRPIKLMFSIRKAYIPVLCNMSVHVFQLIRLCPFNFLKNVFYEFVLEIIRIIKHYS